MNIALDALELVAGTFGLGVFVLVVIVVALALWVLPTIVPGAMLVALLDRRLARPHPMDRRAVQRRLWVILAAFGVATLAGLRVTLAVHDLVVEPSWATALIAAGFAEIVAGVVTLRRDAPWRANAALARALGLHFTLGLAMVFARPLLTLFG